MDTNTNSFISTPSYKNYNNMRVINTSFANILGIENALFLNQLRYWLHKCGRTIKNLPGKWIYNSINSWKLQFPYLSEYKIRKIIRYLEDYELIISKKINAHKWNHTKWYSINFTKYKELTANNNKFKIKRKNNPLINKVNSIKSTNRYVQNEQIIITNNNYTNNISSNEEVTKNNFEIKIEEKIINKMIYIWNKVFEYSVKPIKAYSNKKNQQILLNIYKIVFNSDLDKWRKYACKVNSSQFLMGEKKTKNNFKAVFGWLIKEETIERILNREYGVGDRELDMNNISENIEEKKEEVVNKIDKKISEYIKIKINDKKEREEFIEYVKSASIIEDDRYGILKKIIKQVPKNYILEREEYKGVKENLYESYVMKKYLSITKVEVRKKIRNKMNKIIDEQRKDNKILEELIKKQREIEYLELNNRIDKNGLQAIL
ncbi:hypothetical protein [Rickettsiales endosymbiont of Trichoplax sp. H2]|uniref:hypothetical protein n=1 Tax=Rickettsiales endosymbiont of Trichoplax sp. H2 TaxID=2021221 RepID=UPI0018A85E49|nr:hypothetical protein [Rickettsiales endosymbiont of Trichoplax sp. H2]MSO14644.1 hypothetical protein [Rickettsiales endosymbiont of Trichoplax sp. H2]